jgi:hypothetical protein
MISKDTHRIPCRRTSKRCKEKRLADCSSRTNHEDNCSRDQVYEKNGIQGLSRFTNGGSCSAEFEARRLFLVVRLSSTTMSCFQAQLAIPLYDVLMSILSALSSYDTVICFISRTWLSYT